MPDPFETKTKTVLPPAPSLTKSTHNNADLHSIGDNIPNPTVIKSVGVASLGSSSVPAREDHVHGFNFYDVNGNILFTTTGAGRTYMNGRRTYLPQLPQIYYGGDITSPAYSSFIANGIALDIRANDIVNMTFSCILYSTVAGVSIWAGYFQLYQGGSPVQTSRLDTISATTTGVGTFTQVSTTYVMAIPAAGACTLTFNGGLRTGAVNCLGVTLTAQVFMAN